MSEDFSNLTVPVAEIEEFLECNVCCSIPDCTPIYQCENGHMLCRECHSKLENCPMCRLPLRTTRSLVAEKVLEKLPLRCFYSKNGCNVRLPKHDSMSHRKVCPYRDVVCFMTGCEKCLPVLKLVSHIKSDHQDKLCYTKSNNGKDVLSYIMCEADFDFDQKWVPNLMDFKSFQSWIYGLGPDEEFKYFYCRLKFKGEKETVIYEGPTVSVEKSPDQVLEEGLGMVMSDNLARRLWDGQEIKVFVEIVQRN